MTKFETGSVTRILTPFLFQNELGGAVTMGIKGYIQSPCSQSLWTMPSSAQHRPLKGFGLSPQLRVMKFLYYNKQDYNV